MKYRVLKARKGSYNYKQGYLFEVRAQGGMLHCRYRTYEEASERANYLTSRDIALERRAAIRLVHVSDYCLLSPARASLELIQSA